jgi:DNA-binding transcriptional regulator LsrR (DeoR family)
MHYENGLSQQEIANLLGFSKMTVSRMLQKAKDQDIVRTHVTLPFQRDAKWEEAVKKTFGLSRAWVIKNPHPNGDISAARSHVAKAAAFILNTEPPSNSTVGIGVGRTIGQVVKHLVPMKTENIHFVQLMGGLPDVTKENPFSIIQEICRKWHAGGTFLTSYATAETKEARDSFFQNTDIGKMIYKLWEKCDKAVFGIGTIENGTLLSPELVGAEEIEMLKRSNAIGDILGHCFDAEGAFITTGLEDRLVAIPNDLLRKIPSRRAIALGQFKVAALLGALRSGIITELFTDDCTVAEVLDRA